MPLKCWPTVPLVPCRCPGEGQSCLPVVGRTCQRSVCNGATGSVALVRCDGWCVSAAAPSLVSAILSDDGRQVELSFDEEVTATSWQPRCAWGCYGTRWSFQGAGGALAQCPAISPAPRALTQQRPCPFYPCSAIFAPATALKLGIYSFVAALGDRQKLAVWLDYGAQISVGDAIALATKPSIASWRDPSRLANGGAAVALLAPAARQAPTVLISGPTSLGAGCAGGSAASVAFDASASSGTAGRALTFAWALTAAASQQAALEVLAEEATATSSARLVLPGEIAAALASGGDGYTLSLIVTNWLGASGERRLCLQAGCEL